MTATRRALLRRPEVARLAAALPDAGACGALADVLLGAEGEPAPLADVLEAYALAEPEEGWWRVLGHWLAGQGDGRARQVATVTVGPCEYVRADSKTIWWAVRYPPTYDVPLGGELHADEPAARLARRRRVLRLFGEVRCVRRCEVSQDEFPEPPHFGSHPLLRPFFEANGFLVGTRPVERFIVRTEDRERRCWVYTQGLTPEQLLPPEGAQEWDAGAVHFDDDGRLVGGHERLRQAARDAAAEIAADLDACAATERGRTDRRPRPERGDRPPGHPFRRRR